ncbi:MAG: preprotein translocase subunit SecE [Clostridia bacterium]
MAKSIIKDVKSELTKVVWPTRKQLLRNTVLVLIIILIVSAIVLTFDMIVKTLDINIWNVITNKII